jgi:hypothetical protein
MAQVDPRDEARHQPGDIELWNESYYLDWFTEDGSSGGYVRVGFLPNISADGGGRVWYWACLVGEGQDLVTVIDHDVAMPRLEQSLEVRHDGLWADHHIPEPLERMSCSLESFAVRLDDPAETYHGCRGERVPFGFELDWETDRAAYPWPPMQFRYEIPCRVTGHVSIEDRQIELDCWGQRDHSWGTARDWWGMQWCWSAGRLEDGTRFHAVGDLGPGLDFGVAYILPPDSAVFDEFENVTVDSQVGREGLIDAAQLSFGGLELAVEPVAWSPVLLTHTDGREARFPRALARFTAADGRKGAGWIEFNQPPVS